VVCAGAGIERKEILDLLLQLVRKSLVLAHEAGDGADRYRLLLETLRQYPRERLMEAGEAEALCQQHATYFLAIEETLDPDRTVPTRWYRWARHQGARLDRLEREYDNLRTAVRWLIDSGDAENALRLAEALFQIGDIRGSTTEAKAWLQELVGVPAVADAPAVLNGSCRCWSKSQPAMAIKPRRSPRTMSCWPRTE
jgi:predicted ATPase